MSLSRPPLTMPNLSPTAPRVTNPAALGPPLDLSDAELDAAAAVTNADIARATRRWQQVAPAWAKNLPLATTNEP